MKKQLLSIFAAVSVGAMFAQPATDWSTNQNAMFPLNANITLPGVKFMDAVDANVIWVTGKDYGASGANRNYNWYSRSINGGALFAGGNIYSDTNTFVIANLEGIDANTAWVSAYKKVGPGGTTGGGAIHRTTNGGANWVNMSAAGMFTNSASFANWVTFLTPQVGIANGDPVNGEFELWRTTNGGLSWSLIPGANIPNPLSGEYAIVNLYTKVGTSNLWFGTNGNRIFRSTDAGLTYNAASVGPVTNTVTEIAFTSPLNGVCYMVNAGGTVELWNTTDGGVNWLMVPTPANIGFLDVTAIPGSGILVSYSAGTNPLISYSSDNGATWTDWGSIGIPYITGDFVDASTGWAGSVVTANFDDIWKYSGPAMTGTSVPSAAFSVPATLCLTGPNVTVIPVNTSSGSPTPITYSWTVLPAGGSLSSATATAPTITFNATGSYTISLTATNATGSNTAEWVLDVINCTAPVPSFTLPATACSNFSFATGNTSTGSPAPAYFWSVSPSANVTITPSPAASDPAIQVASAGVYTISLVATNASGSVQATQTINIASCPPNASFSIPSSYFTCDAVKSFSTTNATTNPTGASGSLSYTWSVLPSTGLTVTPNYLSTNMVVKLPATATTNYTITLRARNASGTSTVTQVISADNCSGIAEKTLLSENVVVYPNPAHDQINLALPASVDTYKAKITNILGAVVYEEKALKNSKDGVSINLSNKPKGVYFLTIEANNEKATKKIVIE